MAIGDTPITVAGNVVNDPELRFTPSGAAVCTFRVASTPRRFNKQTNQYEDGDALFLTCNVWRRLAENIAESVSKGMRVIVTGNLRQRSYTNKAGENRTSYEIEVDEVGPSLRYATAHVTRNPRQDSTPGRSYGPRTNADGAEGQHAPATPSAGAPGTQTGHTWGEPAPTGQGIPEENPPF